MEPGRQCDARKDGWPCVLDKEHRGPHTTCDGNRWVAISTWLDSHLRPKEAD